MLSSYPAKYKRNYKGTLYITNLRVCWYPDESEDEKAAEINFPIFKISNKELDFINDIDNNRSVLAIKQGKTKTFSFEEPGHEKTVKIIMKDIKAARDQFESITVSSEERFKLIKLMETPHLRELFMSLVESGNMSDAEFWKTNVEIKQFKIKEREDNMENGASNKRLALPVKYSLDTNSSEIKLDKEDAVELLNQYPAIKQLYERYVIREKHPEDKFWNYILLKNYNFKTEIFGGQNPEYIGFTEEEERAYEDNYINKDIEMEKEDEDGIKQKLRMIEGSANIILNKDFDPQKINLEAYHNAGEFGDEKKENKEADESEKLLFKYNQYSERMLLTRPVNQYSDKEIDTGKAPTMVKVKDVTMA